MSNVLYDDGVDVPSVLDALKKQVIELTSWAVRNSGTRYGVFRELGAARDIWDKIDDCAESQSLCPKVCSAMLKNAGNKQKLAEEVEKIVQEQEKGGE